MLLPRIEMTNICGTQLDGDPEQNYGGNSRLMLYFVAFDDCF